MGRTYGLGGALAILTLVFGMLLNAPTARRMGELAAAAAKRGGPPNADEATELQRLQARLARGSGIVSVLLLLATAAMAVARYVP
jgi:hypothetical protein